MKAEEESQHGVEVESHTGGDSQRTDQIPRRSVLYRPGELGHVHVKFTVYTNCALVLPKAQPCTLNFKHSGDSGWCEVTLRTYFLVSLFTLLANI